MDTRIGHWTRNLLSSRSCGPAVAENQPGSTRSHGLAVQNRMTDSLSILAADVRRLIGRAGSVPSGEFRADFDGLAGRILRFQREKVGVYAAWCRSRMAEGDPGDDWRRFPFLPTAAFKEYDVGATRPGDWVAVFHSSGTTEHRPGRHPHSRETLSVYEASLDAAFVAAMLRPDPVNGSLGPWRFVSLTPTPAAAPHSSLAHMVGFVGRHSRGTPVFLGGTGPGGWELEPAAAAEALRRLGAEGVPLMVLGTAFHFVHLVDFLRDRGAELPLPVGSRVMETGGYKGRSRTVERAELHRLAAGVFGLPRASVVTEYGMSELSSQAYDTGEGLRFPPWVHVSLSDPETGREVPDGACGLVRVLDLANVGSVAALETGDLAVRDGDVFHLRGRAAASEARGCSLLMP